MYVDSQLVSVMKVNHMLTEQNPTLSLNIRRSKRKEYFRCSFPPPFNFLQADMICCSQEMAKDRKKI